MFVLLKTVLFTRLGLLISITTGNFSTIWKYYFRCSTTTRKHRSEFTFTSVQRHFESPITLLTSKPGWICKSAIEQVNGHIVALFFIFSLIISQFPEVLAVYVYDSLTTIKTL